MLLQAPPPPTLLMEFTRCRASHVATAATDSGTDAAAMVVEPTCTPPGPRLIKEGDMVIIRETYDILTHLIVTAHEKTENRWGLFYHDDILGKPFGSSVSPQVGSQVMALPCCLTIPMTLICMMY